MELRDKIALVTGATQGIGRAVALGLAREGAHIVIIDYNENAEAVEELKRKIEKIGRKVLNFRSDVTKKKEIAEAVRISLDTFGRIDILINCAGIYPRTLVVDMSEETWDRTIDTNLKGVFLCCKAVIKPMMEQGEGKIVSIASAGTLIGRIKGAHYIASKAGIIGFTKSLALEVAPYRINVNAIAPGATDTELWRKGKSEEEIEEILKKTSLAKRLARPEDIVGTVIFLVSEASKYITGQVIFMQNP